MSELKPAIISTFLLVALCGFIFPLVIWAGSQLLFPDQANGSFVTDKSGKIVGSRLIGQTFTAPKYFHSRASAAGSGYDPAASSGTNLGPISSKLVQGIKDDPSTPDADESYNGIRDLAQQYREENGLAPDTILPAEAATRSSSGLDPEISPANALLQVARVAKARGISEHEVKNLVTAHTKERFIRLFGEPRVNVLEINLALDAKY